jgi:peroxiredoxin
VTEGPWIASDAVAHPRARAQLIVLVGVLVVLAGGAIVWSRLDADDGGRGEEVRLDEPGEYMEPGSPTNPPLPGDGLPDVELLASDGSPVRLPGDDGRPMVVNLWYSTCAPCARELADFATVHDEVGDQVRFVGVDPLDTVDAMKRFADDRGVRYELLRDDGFAFTDGLGIVAFPATLFVDADGRIVDQTGAIDDDELRDKLAELWNVTA